jgi:hypothetical protein
VFISHSSVDKQFAYRLATDLIAEGFTVWLDAWELRVGDALSDSIHEAITGSTFVLFLISPNSIASPWVDKELKVALVLEAERQDVVMLPLLIGHTDIPAALADRLYLDFGSYRASLEQLTTKLRRGGSFEPPREAHQYQFPVILTHGLFLNKTALAGRITSFSHVAPSGYRVKPEQVIIAPDADYDVLRAHLLDMVDHYPTLDEYDDETYQLLCERYEQIRKLEQALPQGITLILSWTDNDRRIDATWAAEAAHWFCRMIRHRTLHYLRLSLAYGPPPTTPLQQRDYGIRCVPVVSDKDFRTVYALNEDERVTRFDLFDSPQTKSSFFFLPSSAVRDMLFDTRYVHTEPAEPLLLPELVYKFVLPQIVYYHLHGRDYFPTSKASAWASPSPKTNRAPGESLVVFASLHTRAEPVSGLFQRLGQKRIAMSAPVELFQPVSAHPRLDSNRRIRVYMLHATKRQPASSHCRCAAGRCPGRGRPLC